jgi:hypothetical protein
LTFPIRIIQSVLRVTISATLNPGSWRPVVSQIFRTRPSQLSDIYTATVFDPAVKLRGAIDRGTSTVPSCTTRIQKARNPGLPASAAREACCMLHHERRNKWMQSSAATCAATAPGYWLRSESRPRGRAWMASMESGDRTCVVRQVLAMHVCAVHGNVERDQCRAASGSERTYGRCYPWPFRTPFLRSLPGTAIVFATGTCGLWSSSRARGSASCVAADLSRERNCTPYLHSLCPSKSNHIPCEIVLTSSARRDVRTIASNEGWIRGAYV